MALNVVPFYSSIAPMDVIESLNEKLESSGVRVLLPEKFLDELKIQNDLIHQRTLVFVGTGGTENNVADFVHNSGIEPPLMLLSHPNNNSLPAAMEIRTYLERNGLKSRIIHHPLEEIVEKLSKWNQFSTHLTNIRRSRIGLFGDPSSWLIASNVDLDIIREIWGVEITKYDLSRLEEGLSNLDSSEIASKYLETAKNIAIPKEEVEKGARVAETLLKIIESENLTSVTIQCFDFLMKNSVSGCLAVCHANDLDGITAGCEGDFPAMLSMMIAKELTGQSSFMANVTNINKAENSATFAHCTVPTSLVKGFELLTHFESNLSVGIRGIFDTQEVTILKVFGRDLLEHWVASGVIQENIADESGCRTQIRVTIDQDVSYFLERSLGNHHIIIPGNHSELINEFFSFVQFKE